MAIRNPALLVSSAASSPTGGAKTGPEDPTDLLASPLGGGAPAGGGEGPHPPSRHCEERSDVAIRPPPKAFPWGKVARRSRDG